MAKYRIQSVPLSREQCRYTNWTRKNLNLTTPPLNSDYRDMPNGPPDYLESSTFYDQNFQPVPYPATYPHPDSQKSLLKKCLRSDSRFEEDLCYQLNDCTTFADNKKSVKKTLTSVALPTESNEKRYIKDVCQIHMPSVVRRPCKKRVNELVDYYNKNFNETNSCLISQDEGLNNEEDKEQTDSFIKNSRPDFKQTLKPDENLPISSRLIANYLNLNEEFRTNDKKNKKSREQKFHQEEGKQKVENDYLKFFNIKPDDRLNESIEKVPQSPPQKSLACFVIPDIPADSHVKTDSENTTEPIKDEKETQVMIETKKLKTKKQNRSRKPSNDNCEEKIKSSKDNETHVKKIQMKVVQPEVRYIAVSDKSSNKSVGVVKSRKIKRRTKLPPPIKDTRPPWNANVASNSTTFNVSYQHLNKKKVVLEKKSSIFAKYKKKQNEFRQLYQKTDEDEAKNKEDIQEIFNYIDQQVNEREMKKNQITLKDIDYIRKKNNFDGDVKKLEGWKLTAKNLEELLEKEPSDKNTPSSPEDNSPRNSKKVASPSNMITERIAKKYHKDMKIAPPIHKSNFFNKPLQDIPEHTCVQRFEVDERLYQNKRSDTKPKLRPNTVNLGHQEIPRKNRSFPNRNQFYNDPNALRFQRTMI